MTNIALEVEKAIIDATGLRHGVDTHAAAHQVVARLTLLGVIAEPPDKSKTVDKFLTRVAEGDPIATSVADVIEECGLRVGSRGGKNGTRKVAAMKLLEDVYLAQGRPNLRFILGVLYSAFGDEGLDRNMLAALAEVLGTHGDEVDKGHLANVLRGLTFAAVRQDANGRFYARGKRWRSSAIASTLVDAYNVGPMPNLEPGLILARRERNENPITPPRRTQ